MLITSYHNIINEIRLPGLIPKLWEKPNNVILITIEKLGDFFWSGNELKKIAVPVNIITHNLWY